MKTFKFFNVVRVCVLDNNIIQENNNTTVFKFENAYSQILSVLEIFNYTLFKFIINQACIAFTLNSIFFFKENDTK